MIRFDAVVVSYCYLVPGVYGSHKTLDGLDGFNRAFFSSFLDRITFGSPAPWRRRTLMGAEMNVGVTSYWNVCHYPAS